MPVTTGLPGAKEGTQDGRPLLAFLKRPQDRDNPLAWTASDPIEAIL